MDSIGTYPADYNSPTPSSPRRDSAVSTTKSTMHRTHGSRSSSRSSRQQPSYDRQIMTQGPRRIHSAPYGQLPQMNVEAAIAFHERSCALFRPTSTAAYPSSPAYLPTTAYASTTAYPSSPAYPSTTAYASTAAYPPSTAYAPTPLPLPSSPPRSSHRSSSSAAGSPETWASDADALDEKLALDDESGDAPPTTEIRWTSDSTRRREYAAIDRAHAGFKGMLRRMFPRIAARSSASRFYREGDGSDAGSVRRYRLDLEEDEGEEEF